MEARKKKGAGLLLAAGLIFSDERRVHSRLWFSLHPYPTPDNLLSSPRRGVNVHSTVPSTQHGFHQLAERSRAQSADTRHGLAT